MEKYKEVEGDLIKLALKDSFDVIAHGCNCQCIMGAGIAPQMAKQFGCHTFPLEDKDYKGDINKLGTIDYRDVQIGWKTYKGRNMEKCITVVNAYTQFDINGRKSGKIDLDYEALTLCLRKMNKIFKGKHIGLPQIGSGLAGGDWTSVKKIIQNELKDCMTTIVIYKPN